MLCTIWLISAPLLAQQPGQASALLPYTSCTFADGLQLVQTDPLAPGITARTVDTADGPRQIDMLAGVRVMFAYPDSDFYANVKVELLPAANYPQFKRALIDNFQFLAKDNIVNTSIHSMKGFEVQGLDRAKLEGGVLGIYLLFDDSTHVVTTVYMLNQEPQNRKFHSLEEYGLLRDQFLKNYTSCIRANQKEQ